MGFVVEVVQIPGSRRMGSNSLMVTLLFQVPETRACSHLCTPHWPNSFPGSRWNGGGEQCVEGSLHFFFFSSTNGVERIQWAALKQDFTLFCRSLNSLSKCYCCRAESYTCRSELLCQCQGYCSVWLYYNILMWRNMKQNSRCLFSYCMARFAENAPVVSVQDLRPRTKNDSPRSQFCPVQRGAPPQRRQQGSPHLPFPPHLLDRLLCKCGAL